MEIFRSSLVASSPDSGLALMKKDVNAARLLYSIRKKARIVPTILEHVSVDHLNLFTIICHTKSILANVSRYVMCTARITFMSLSVSQAPCNHPHTSQSPELLRTVYETPSCRRRGCNLIIPFAMSFTIHIGYFSQLLNHQPDLTDNFA